MLMLQKIVIIGGGGRLGPTIVTALLEAKVFQVSVVSRESSKASYSQDGVKDIRVSDEMRHDELVKAFAGQDALIICIAGALSAPAIKFADAAAEAGVKRVIPADFGSCDSADPHSLQLLPLYREKKKVRDHLETLSQRSQGGSDSIPPFTWTSLITGHFLDYGIKSGLMQIDLETKKARTFDGGNVKWSATVLPDIGLATVKILQKPKETQNRLLYVQSVLASQNDLIKSVEKAIGAKLEINDLDSAQFIKEHLAKLAENESDADATEELVSVEGIINANWEKRDGFANSLLEVRERDLDEIVKEALQ